MKLRHTSFWDIIRRNAASASCSLMAGGSASGFAARIPAGIVAWMSASSEGWPRAASMARTSASEGPTWRGTNVSGAGSGVTAKAPEERAGCSKGQESRENSRVGTGARAYARAPDARREGRPQSANARTPAPSLGPAPAGRRAFARGSPVVLVRSVLRRGVRHALDLLLAVVHRQEHPPARPLPVLVLRRHRETEPVLLRFERHAVVHPPRVVARVTHHRDRIAATVRERHLGDVRRA